MLTYRSIRMALMATLCLRTMTRILMDRFVIQKMQKFDQIVQIDETVDPEKQQFLQDKAMKDETKDIVVEGSKEGVGKGKRELVDEEGEDTDVEPVNRSGSFKVET